MPFTPTYPVPDERKPYTLIAEPGNGNGRIGCLMLHGFMGSPYSSRPMADYLVSQGITMHCPLLPGHGYWPNKLHKVSHQSWLAEAEEGLTRIRELADKVFIIGHSMGTVMGAHLINKFQDIRGMAMLTPLYAIPDNRLIVMPLLRYVMPWLYPHKIGSMRDLVRQRVLDFDPTLDFDSPAVQARLPEMSRMPTSGLAEMVKMVRYGRQFWSKLKLPVLIFQGGDDPAVPDHTMAKIYNMLPSQEKELKTFPDAGHELMRPFEPVHTQVWQHIRDFFRKYADWGLETGD
jgi:carboxylesterase